ncbi:hypothetical protein SANTM175S_04016 [Streptomyces antimycoticus]
MVEQPLVPPPAAGIQANLTSYAWPGLRMSVPGWRDGSGSPAAASPAVWSTTRIREASAPPWALAPTEPLPSTVQALSEMFATRNEP